MSGVGTIKAVVSGLCSGLVIYPRRYVVGDTPESSAIHGVDQEGNRVVVKLTIPQHFLDAAKAQKDLVVPSIENFAETGRRARNPCIASDDNSAATKTGGVLLLEQVSVVDAEKGFFTANWASILKDWEDGLDPLISVGFLETNLNLPFNPEVEALKIELRSINEAIDLAKKTGDEAPNWNGLEGVDLIEKRNQLSMELFSLAKMYFVGVEVQYRRMEELDVGNEVLAKRQVVELIQSNSVNGVYGGVILRPYKVVGGEKIVDVGDVRHLNHQYDFVNKMVPPVESVWDDFMSKGKGSGWIKFMASKGMSVDVIPVKRVNCGPVSKERFQKDYLKGDFKRLKAYVDEAFYYAPYAGPTMKSGFLATPIAMRLAPTGRAHGFNILLSNIHAFGKPLDNALLLGKNMASEYKFKSKPEPKVLKKTSSGPSPS